MTPDHERPMRSATRDLILTGLICALGAMSLVTLSVRNLARSHGTNDEVIECIVDGAGTMTCQKTSSDPVVIVRRP